MDFLPALNIGYFDFLEQIGIVLDEELSKKGRWACLHRLQLLSNARYWKDTVGDSTLMFT